jgi:transcriptional regulator with XRE-family HTH domain
VQTEHRGKSIRAIRQLRDLKQDTFARKLGMSQQNVSKMEKDGLTLELEKVKAELEEYKKNKRKPANLNEPKLKPMPGKQVAQ